MLFTTFPFLIFFLVVYLLFWLTSRCRKIQNIVLLVSSLFFYAYADWRLLFLLFFVITASFCSARLISYSSSTKVKRWSAASGVSICLLTLGVFKYLNFFADSLTVVLKGLHLKADMPTLNIILPIGISFFTFQAIAYILDIYYQRQTACRNFWDYTLFISWFPQLVAGPIERCRDLLPQLTAPKKIDWDKICSACQLILIGYCKKMFIADNVAGFVDACYANGELGAGAMLVGVFLFSLQIYGDFAGYTDIARGVSRLFGVELTLNFRQPYFSTNITDFWRRWHISLSNWFLCYVYIPLGGNRKGKMRTYLNNFLTMLLCGLWHGAGWNFVIWGGLHGLYLAIHKACCTLMGDGKQEMEPFFKKNWKTLFTCLLVSFSWIFFRAPNLTVACMIFKQCFHWGSGFFIGFELYGIALLLFGTTCFLIDYFSLRCCSEVPFSPKTCPWVRGLIYAVLIILLFMIGDNYEMPFIYFQF